MGSIERIKEYGWSSYWTESFEAYRKEGLLAGRVIEEQRGAYQLMTEMGEVAGELSGRFRHAAKVFPAVGDWAALRLSKTGGPGLVEAILPRRSRLVRGAAGEETKSQFIAANVDTVFLLSPADRRLAPSSLERYLTMLWESGARPVVLLSKADLGTQPIVTDTGVSAHAVSALTGEGIDTLEKYLTPGATVCLVGASGSGKSTLLNRLMGGDSQPTQEVRRKDGKGRHTTTVRQLFRLPGGALMIDTPGMRELQLWADGGLNRTFSEVASLAASCRFRDCRHEGEPDCAVEAGMEPRRFLSWRKQQRELAAQAERKRRAEKEEARRRWKKMSADRRRRRSEED